MKSKFISKTILYVSLLLITSGSIGNSLVSVSATEQSLQSENVDTDTEIDTNTENSEEEIINAEVELDISAETAILIDAKTGQVLYKKNHNQTMYPASTTKLMTALLALENCELTDSFIFSENAVMSIPSGSSSIAMQPNEEMTIEESLYAIFLRSANEVTNGLAEYIGGDLDNFAVMMTDRAKELGCENTNFINSHGLYDENHYTSAYDLALIGQELLKQEGILEILQSIYYEIPPNDIQPETRYLHGQHQMMKTSSMYYDELVIGGKSGFVNESLNTLVTFAENDDITLIAVVLRCSPSEQYEDTATLFEYGFSNYKTLDLLNQQNTSQSIKIVENINNQSYTLDEITLLTPEDISITVPLDVTEENLVITYSFPTEVDAPIYENDSIGYIEIINKLDDSVISSIPLLSNKTVLKSTEEEAKELTKNPFLDSVWYYMLSTGAKYFFVALIIQTLFGFANKKYQEYAKNQRYR